MAVLPYQGTWAAAGVAAQAERYRHDLVAADGRGPEGPLEAVAGLQIAGDGGTVLSSLRRRRGWLELRVVREHPHPGTVGNADAPVHPAAVGAAARLRAAADDPEDAVLEAVPQAGRPARPAQLHRRRGHVPGRRLQVERPLSKSTTTSLAPGARTRQQAADATRPSRCYAARRSYAVHGSPYPVHGDAGSIRRRLRPCQT